MATKSRNSNSKFNPFIKLTAILLTLIFAALTGLSSLNYLKSGIFYADDKKGLTNTVAFSEEIRDALLNMTSLKSATEIYEKGLSYEDFLKTDTALKIQSTYTTKQTRATKLFNAIQQIKPLMPTAVETYDGTVTIYPGESAPYSNDLYQQNEYTVDGIYISSEMFEELYSEYYGLNLRGYYNADSLELAEYSYSTDEELFSLKESYDSFKEWNIKYQQLRHEIFEIVDTALSSEQITEDLNNSMEDNLKEIYLSAVDSAESIIESLKNVQFILTDNENGNTISNVDANERKAFIKTLDANSLFYISFDGKNLNSPELRFNPSENLLNLLTETAVLTTEPVDGEFLSELFDGYTLYLKIDKKLVQGDSFYSISQTYNSVGDTPAEKHFKLAVLFSLLSCLCFVGCCVMCGKKKDGSASPMLCDKIPFVIYLGFSFVIVYLTGICTGYVTLAALSPALSEINNTPSLLFITENGIVSAVAAVGFAIVSAALLSLVTYTLRNAKANTLTNRFISVVILKKLLKVLGILKSYISERELSYKQRKRRTLVCIGIYVIVNSLLFIISHTELIAIAVVLMVIFNSLAVVYALLYLTDVNRLAEIAKDTRNGNYKNKIKQETFVAPLREFAEDLSACRNGIENAVEEAVKGERLKTELITNVSHDLKTPLTSIINYVSLLKMDKLSSEEKKQYIEILDEKSKKLKRLIEDLTEASKANSGNIKMNLVQVNLNELARQAVGENSDILENAGLDIVLTEQQENITVYADSQHTFRIIDNLFSNARKYSLTGTRVYIDIRLEDGYGVLEMKNISREKLNIDPSELTERFVRGDNSRTTDGSGLGLSIAACFAELQKGSFDIVIDGDMFKAIIKLPIYSN